MNDYEEFDFDYLVNRMNRYISSMGEITKLSLDVTVEIIENKDGEMIFNAFARKISNKKYKVYIYKYLFTAIKNGVSMYLEHINKEDLITFKNDKGEYEFYDNYYCFFTGDGIVEKFYNHICSFILDNIIRHELGHILLGHLENDHCIYKEKDTFEAAKSFYYQNLEMQADWFGVIRGLSGNITFDLESPSFNIYKSKEYGLIKKLSFCYLIAIYVQHSIFFQNDWKTKKELKDTNFINRVHACELVRMRYNYDALVFALSNMLFSLKKDSEEKCHEYADAMVFSLFDDLNKFLKYFERYTYEDILEDDSVNFYYLIIQLEKYYDRNIKSMIAFENVTPKLSYNEFGQYISIQMFTKYYKELTNTEKNELGI